MAELLTLESWQSGKVTCSFESDYGRYVYLECVDGEVHELATEPSLALFPEQEQYYMKCVCIIVYVLTHGYNHNL